MIEKYVLQVDIDHETGEEHCTVLKTDGTTNMANWIEIVSAMYTHHSILEPLVDELNNKGVFEGKDVKHYQRWVNQIKKYIEEDNPDFTYDDDFIIKIALSYTLQSLRNGESLKRFQWDYKELKSE